MGSAISGSAFQLGSKMGLSANWQDRQRHSLLKRKEEDDPQISSLYQQGLEMNKSDPLSSISSKLQAGGELTPDELKYLKENDPEAYKEALEIKQEREAYKKRIAACKTKEDVDRVHLDRMQSFLNESRGISRNPNLPSSEKKQQLEKVMKKAMGDRSEYLKFIRSEKYASLPETNLDKDAKDGQKKRFGQPSFDEIQLKVKNIWEELESIQIDFKTSFATKNTPVSSASSPSKQPNISIDPAQSNLSIKA